MCDQINIFHKKKYDTMLLWSSKSPIGISIKCAVSVIRIRTHFDALNSMLCQFFIMTRLFLLLKKIHYAKILSTEPYNLFVYIDVAFPAYILEGFKFDKNVEISPKKA